MSEENLINVEDDAPEPVASAAPGEPDPGAVAAGAGEPPVLADDDVDLNSIDVKDEGRVRGLIGELSRKRAENRTLKQQAEKAQQLEQELAQSRPYVDFLRNNQHLLQPPPPKEEAPAPPQADPDAVEAARLMDFYKADGTPDVDRGAKWLALQDRRSGRVAQQAVQPWAQQNVQERANANYQTFNAWAQSQGIRKEITDGIWTSAQREPNGIHTLANPDSVRALALLALGANVMATPKQPAPPAREPVVTEAAGGRGSLQPIVKLSGIEERVLSQRGMKADEYAKLTKDFKPGVSNVLED